MTQVERIRQTIEQFPLGEPFFPIQLITLGSRNYIDQTLFRLEKEGVVSRIARGIYMRPKKNRFLGVVMPNAFQVAQKLAEITGEMVQVNGAEATRQLGLSTQVSVKPVYWTSGPDRRFRMGEQEVILKHVASRKIAHAGSIVGLAITALWYLGKETVSFEVLEKIKAQMTAGQYQEFLNAVSNMPTWLVNLLQKFEYQHE